MRNAGSSLASLWKLDWPEWPSAYSQGRWCHWLLGTFLTELLLTTLRPWSWVFGELGKEMPVFPWSSHYSWWNWPALWLLGAVCWLLVLTGAYSMSCAYYLSTCTAGTSQFLLLLLILGCSSSLLLLVVFSVVSTGGDSVWGCTSLQLVVPLPFVWGRRCLFTSLWGHLKAS